MLSCPGLALRCAPGCLGGKGVVQVARHLAAREDTTRALPLDAREQHHSLKVKQRTHHTQAPAQLMPSLLRLLRPPGVRGAHGLRVVTGGILDGSGLVTPKLSMVAAWLRPSFSMVVVCLQSQV